MRQDVLVGIVRSLPAAGCLLLAGCQVYDWQLKDESRWKKPDTAATLAEAGIEQAVYNSQIELLIAVQHLGMRNPQIASTLDELARLHVQQGNYAAAEHLRGRLQELGGAPAAAVPATVSYTGAWRGRTVDDALANHYETAGLSVNRIAASYSSAGNYPTAEQLHLRALQIVESGLGSEHMALVEILRAYAQTKAGLLALDSARALLERSVSIIEVNRGADDLLLVESLDRIAGLHLLDEQFEPAASFYERSLRIRRLHLDADDQQIALNLANLALALSRQGALQEAAATLEDAVSVQQAGLGPHHSDVLINLEQLAAVYDRMGDIEMAAYSYERILEIRDRVYGYRHVSVVDASLRLGDYYRQLAEYRLARDHYQRAFDIATDIFGAEHPETAAIVERIADLKASQGY